MTNFKYILAIFFAFNMAHALPPQLAQLVSVEKVAAKKSLFVPGGSYTMSVSGTGTISYAQAYFYGTYNSGNQTCDASTLLGTASVLDSVNYLTFTNNQVININSSSLYQLAANKGLNTSQINCMRFVLASDSVLSKGVSCTTFQESCVSSNCTTTTPTASGNWITNPSDCSTRYAYIPNANATGNITQCSVDSSGDLLNCTDVTSMANALATFASNGYLYVVGDNKAEACPLSVLSSGTSVGSCQTPTSISNAIALITNGPYAYVANYNSTNITQCSVSATTGILSCGTPQSNMGDSPNDIYIYNGYAYIASFGDNTVYQCPVSTSTGVISTTDSCSTPATTMSNADSVIIYNGYLYVANGGTDTITVCPVSSGVISSWTACYDSGLGTFTNPFGVWAYNGYLYVSADDTVKKCLIDGSDGTLISCNNTGYTGANTGTPAYIFVNPTQLVIY